jgi:hypothetical protein
MYCVLRNDFATVGISQGASIWMDGHDSYDGEANHYHCESNTQTDRDAIPSGRVENLQAGHLFFYS